VFKPNAKVAISVIAAANIALVTGCASTAPTGSNNKIQIVASTSVWGELAAEVGGDQVQVHSLIDSPQQDPHSYQATARDQLAVNQADLLVENGDGYDQYFAALAASAKKHPVVVANIVQPQPSATNPHLWYRLSYVSQFVEVVRQRLTKLDAGDADLYRRNADALQQRLDGLVQREKKIASALATLGGATYFAPESIADYLLADCGLTDVTPAAVRNAVMNEGEISAATMLATEKLLAAKQAKVFVGNPQTETTQTMLLRKLAEKSKLRVVGFTELLPKGKNFESWMSGNLDALFVAGGA
jgi:zinc/manganese transport system substrate-binding protein